VFESELADHIPVVHCSIAGTRIVGRMCVGEIFTAAPSLNLISDQGNDAHSLAGNSKGLLLPNSTTDQEMLHIRNSLPEKIVVQVAFSFCRSCIIF
jgi:translation initiation factor 6